MKGFPPGLLILLSKKRCDYPLVNHSTKSCGIVGSSARFLLESYKRRRKKVKLKQQKI
jgi:hypothetical protein